jgi:hypothetical protein
MKTHREGGEAAARKRAHPRSVKTVDCLDCGRVEVQADVFERGNPTSGICPDCGERLYFATGTDSRK